MLMKNILGAFAIAGLATAAPAENIEARAAGGTCSAGPSRAWCCVTAFPLNIFFIQGVGSNCKKAAAVSGSSPVQYTCTGSTTAGHPDFICCANNQIGPDQNNNVVCAA